MVDAVVTVRGDDGPRIYGTYRDVAVLAFGSSVVRQFAVMDEPSMAVGEPAEEVSATTATHRQVSYRIIPIEDGYGPLVAGYLPRFPHYIHVGEDALTTTMAFSGFDWLGMNTWDAAGWSTLVQQDVCGRNYVSIPAIISYHEGLEQDREYRRRVGHRRAQSEGHQHSLARAQMQVPDFSAEVEVLQPTKGPAIGRNPRKLGI